MTGKACQFYKTGHLKLIEWNKTIEILKSQFQFFCSKLKYRFTACCELPPPIFFLWQKWLFDIIPLPRNYDQCKERNFSQEWAKKDIKLATGPLFFLSFFLSHFLFLCRCRVIFVHFCWLLNSRKCLSSKTYFSIQFKGIGK